MNLNLTNIYIDNFIKFINNKDVRLDKSYYEKLYKIIYSKNTNTKKIHIKLLELIPKKENKPITLTNQVKSFFKSNEVVSSNKSSSPNESNKSNENNNINERRTKGGAKSWIEILINMISNLEKNKIDISWIDAKSTTFNMFQNKYNTLIDNIVNYYKNIVLKCMSTKKPISSLSFSEPKLPNGSPNKLSIETIYDNIVKSGIVKINKEDKNEHSLFYYYNKMVKSTKNPNTKKHDFSIKIVVNGQTNSNAITKNGKFLAKFREIKFGNKELHISKLYYDIRKVAQILMLLLPTITYYENQFKFVKNETLRKELLYTILILRSLISRSNLNNITNNSSGEYIQPHKSIRNAFRRVLQNNYSDSSPNEITNLFKNIVSYKSNEEVRVYINKLTKLIKILVPEKNANKINRLIKERIQKD